MLSQEKIVDQTMEGITGLLREYAKTAAIDNEAQKTFLVFIRTTLSASLSAALRDSELHRHVNTEMRQGLQHIYKAIASLASSTKSDTPKDAGKLFSEAAEQLNEVMATTLEATETIMQEVESLQDKIVDVRTILHSGVISGNKEGMKKIAEHAEATDAALTQIMTTLSFQDLTGQRLKKVVAALSEIQTSIFDIYVSSGLMLKAGEEMPEKNINEIAAESKRRMTKFKDVKDSELKGPTRDVNQNAVDSLLADLGL